MELSELEKSSLLAWYESFYLNYIKGDIAALIPMLDDGFIQIGSAESEVFFNKLDALQFIHDTIDQVRDNIDMRNRVVKAELLDGYVMMNDFFDMYVKNEERWEFYSKFRASTLIEKKDHGWQFIYQHSSVPDVRTVEGENIAIEKITKENIELRDAVKRRTIELEEKNKELAMEAALERVRTMAMGMRKPDDLPGICEVLFNELRSMGFMELRNAMINIYNDEQATFVNNDYSDLIGRSITHLTYDIHPLIEKQTRQVRSKHDAFSETVFSGQDLTDLKAFRKRIGDKDDPRIDHVSALYVYFYSIETGAIGISTFGPISAEKLEQLKRFRNVFEFAYRRYMDVAQAEAQAREATIEVALERVRSKTMAMHNSLDVGDTVATMFDQLLNLGVTSNRCGILIFGDTGITEVWTAKANTEGKAALIIGYLDVTIHPMLISVIDAWKNKEQFFSYELAGEDIKNYYTSINNFPGYPTRFNLDDLPASELHSDFYFPEGAVFAFTPEPIPTESALIFKRFAGVFGQTYRRYLDLQKAEAQAKEAQIEAALERVRSRTMGMQKSEELKEVIKLVYQQLIHLKINLDHSGFVVDYTPGGDWHFWIADEQDIPSKITHPYFESFWANQFNEAKEKGADFFVTNLNFEEKNKFYHELLSYVPGLPEATKDFYLNCPGLAASTVLFDNISLYIENFSGIPYTDEENNTLMRFGKVFQQTYTRFLDLQKAEAQALEAQIELGLERVRARAMAMQNTGELSDLVATLLHELTKLDFSLTFCIINIYNEPDKSNMVWAANPQEGKAPESYYMKFEDYPFHHAMMKEWKAGTPKFVYVLEGKEKEVYDDYLYTDTEFKRFPEEIQIANRALDRYVASFVFSQFGGLQTVGNKPLSDESLDILYRFGKVFNQTYTRFLDLQKAEAQAREATIETSLERMRAKTMAMHSSYDVSETAAAMFTELEKLAIVNLRGGIAIISEDQTMEVWGITNMEDGKMVKSAGIFEMKAHPLWTKLFKSWKQKEEIFIATLSGKDKEDYIEILNKSPQYLSQPLAQIPDVHFLGYYFGEGYIWTMSLLPPDQEDQKILRKFAAVFSLTFRRYLDLKKAEAQALEAIKRASVDRIRAEIASMRTTTDLDKITPLIWKELTILGIPFVRCGVFIMDEQEELIHTFLSTPDGKAIAAIHLPYQSSPLADSLEFWREKKIYLTHWGTQEYSEFADAFLGNADSEKRTQFLSSVPKQGIYLHLLPFLQGMLYVGNITQLEEDSLNLIQSVADAFSTAYARYEDFNRLESAKEQVDKTLTDLKQAQSQLVQAEKMASLGELTAGIAHEIQNPLNFVNNFSDINTELSDEIVEAAKKGDLEEIIQLAADIKSNQDKISEHGKRADAIVKGMLQHSRSSSGIKEPTDINKLVDEYLRLAYHGLRAKDKSFNAILDTDFDPAIGKIPIMPQDFGRVLLNLYNNAFYAVSEKMNEAMDGYEPRVTVSTRMVPASENSLIRQSANSIIISVKDNGNGIPQKVLDKIFQPFFTTKPTGQGTGLGLSLSYDIVKAHGGELRVETKEEEGSEFIIQLPF